MRLLLLITMIALGLAGQACKPKPEDKAASKLSEPLLEDKAKDERKKVLGQNNPNSPLPPKEIIQEPKKEEKKEEEKKEDKKDRKVSSNKFSVGSTARGIEQLDIKNSQIVLTFPKTLIIDSEKKHDLKPVDLAALYRDENRIDDWILLADDQSVIYVFDLTVIQDFEKELVREDTDESVQKKFEAFVKSYLTKQNQFQTARTFYTRAEDGNESEISHPFKVTFGEDGLVFSKLAMKMDIMNERDPSYKDKPILINWASPEESIFRVRAEEENNDVKFAKALRLDNEEEFITHYRWLEANNPSVLQQVDQNLQADDPDLWAYLIQN